MDWPLVILIGENCMLAGSIIGGFIIKRIVANTKPRQGANRL